MSTSHTPSSAELSKTLHNLKITTKPPSATKKSKSPVAESWEDEATSSSSDTETNLSPPTPITQTTSNIPPNPPPPTPASPTPFDFPSNIPPYSPNPSPARRPSATSPPTRRPEKTTAVAGRLIAGALGVKAPKRTEEEREFDRVVREKERRRREEEKERVRMEEREKEERLRSVWED